MQLTELRKLREQENIGRQEAQKQDTEKRWTTENDKEGSLRNEKHKNLKIKMFNSLQSDANLQPEMKGTKNVNMID